MEPMEYLWKDRKRHLGLPLSFTRYRLSVQSSDRSMPHLDLKNVKNPREVKELIHQNVEAAKDKRRMRTTELMGGPDGGPDLHEGDELDDDNDEFEDDN